MACIGAAYSGRFGKNKRTMNEYRNLDIWHKAIELGVIIHRMTEAFPKECNRHLKEDLMRSALKISTKIAEGYIKGSELDLAQYIEYSMRTCGIVDSLLSLGTDLGYLTREELEIVRAKISVYMDHVENRQVVPWSPLEEGWHYEPEAEGEEGSE